ncbi:hypothetical protein JMUB7542_27810 [Staphylococcus aureus]
MCIRDSNEFNVTYSVDQLITQSKNTKTCLLYTSDAADEGLGVDLGGRRIIKKKIFFKNKKKIVH